MPLTTMEMSHLAIAAPATPRLGARPQKRAEEFQTALDRYLADYRECQKWRPDAAPSPRIELFRDTVQRLLKTVRRAALAPLPPVGEGGSALQRRDG